MIKLTGVDKHYQLAQTKHRVLNNISLHIEQGEFVAIMGPSGSGKSTLLNIIGMLDTVSVGEYSFLQKPIAQLSEAALTQYRKQHIGFIFQSFNLVDELTVKENIELALLYQNINKVKRNQLVEEVLDKVALAHKALHFPMQLSGGQQQRVAVARAIVGNQDLILADEPTGNLDSQQGRDVMAILQELHAQGATVIMVTHSAAHADYASRIINLFDGQIINESLSRRYVG